MVWVCRWFGFVDGFSLHMVCLSDWKSMLCLWHWHTNIYYKWLQMTTISSSIWCNIGPPLSHLIKYGWKWQCTFVHTQSHSHIHIHTCTTNTNTNKTQHRFSVRQTNNMQRQINNVQRQRQTICKDNNVQSLSIYKHKQCTYTYTYTYTTHHKCMFPSCTILHKHNNILLSDGMALNQRTNTFEAQTQH
jgi:hypothetical protein